MSFLNGFHRSKLTARVAVLVAFCLLFDPCAIAWAEEHADATQCTTCEKKYFFGVPPVLLQEIKVTGAIVNSGLHYVPKGTDLMTLLVAAGGLKENATSEVILRRGDKSYHFDSDDIFRGKDRGANVKLENQDLVYIPPDTRVANDSSLRLLQVIGTFLGVAVVAWGVARR